MAAKQEVSFKSILGRFDSNLWHFHVPVLLKHAKQFIDGKDKRIICTLQKAETFQAALMPMGNGDYFINIDKKLRDILRLNEGDEVFVSLQKDTSEYGLPVPAEFAELLKQDIEGNDVFHKLTAGKQRTLLYIIGKPKAADLRIRNGIVILEHLKRNKGVIHYKQLNIEMKNS